MALVFSVGWASVGIMILVILAIGELIAGEPVWMSTSLDRGLASLIVVAFFSALASPWRPNALVAVAFMGTAALVVVRAVVLATLRDNRFVTRFLGAWAIGGVAASLIGMAFMGRGLNARAEIPGLGYNALGTTLAISAALLLGLSLDGPRLRRLLYTVGVPIVAVGLVLTWSRGAWLGAVLGLGTLWAATANRRFWVGVVAAAVILAVATPVLAPRWRWHEARLREVAVAEGRFSRIAIWREVPRIVAEHPIFGTGLGTFGAVYARATGQDPSDVPPFAHDLFLNSAVETGLLGLAALLYFLGSGMQAVVRWWRRSQPGSTQRVVSASVLAAFAALMGHQLVDGTVMGVHIAFGLYALLALGAAADRRSRNTA